jgi:alpha-galactosidase/6-phospho-beta-glucosidase family protein
MNKITFIGAGSTVFDKNENVLINLGCDLIDFEILQKYRLSV